MSLSSNNKTADQNVDTEDDKARVRVSKACSRCRTRKDRCDGLKPACTPCQNAAKPCSYEPTTKKRGLPEGYVRGLEKLVTLASYSVEGLEDVLVGYLRDEELRKNWNASAGDELYTRWKDSRVHNELDLFLQDSSAGSKRKRDESETSSPRSRLETILDSLREKGYRIGTEDDAANAKDTRRDAEADVGAENEALHLPANSKELLDAYFSHVACWFPVLSRPVVLKIYYGLSRKPPDSQMNSTVDLQGGKALLWAIFAYATVISSDTNDRYLQSRLYSENSLRYIPNPARNPEDVKDFDSTHAQALLILSLLRLGNGQWVGAWMCTGRAVRILLALREPRLAKTTKGVFQGCFILETLLNVHFQNSRPLLPASLVEADMLEEDGHDEWESWGSSADSHQSPSFTLSIFNRLTKVFLILHDVLQDPASASNPSYVQQKLTAIDELAQEHFRCGIGSPTVNSPPHHIYFQVGLLFAQLRVVARLDEIQSVQFELTQLTTNVLGLFEICSKSHGLNRVPPIFADILNLAFEQANGAKVLFEASSASPSYQDFVAAASDFRAQLASTWASFRSRTETQETPPEVDRQKLPPNGVSQKTQYLQRDLDFGGDMVAGDVQPRLMSPYTPVSGDVVIQNQWQPRQQNAISPAGRAEQNRSPALSLGARSNSMNQSTWPTFATGNNNFGSGFPAPSPSFQGDEVDAIFHEMAHLDKNEWTNERMLGLRDFGFTDESAFMEFCNDPERLALPIESNVPLSSSRQSWTFAAQPP